MSSYQDVRAWREAVDLAVVVHQLTEGFPRREVYGLASQMRDAAVSIPSNIAEGQGRETRGEWLQFLGHARGSLYELQTQILVARRLDYLDEGRGNELQQRAEAVDRCLSGFIEFVRNRAELRKPTKNEKRKTRNDSPEARS